MVLFLLPVIPTTVVFGKVGGNTIACTESASASVMYAYFNVGYVYITSSGPCGTGYDYCAVMGNPGNACGVPVHRVMNG